MDFRKEYERWLMKEDLDPELKQELRKISGNEKEIEDRFYKSLEFGTGGLRGIMGAGTNRMNRYTIRKATLGLAQYIAKQGEQAKKQGVVIAYDSRHQSREFAQEASLVLAKNGIKAFLFEELRPTPGLSFAVRHLGAAAGLVITASHNPPEYNGYKVYWTDGAQVTSELAGAIIKEISSIPDELEIPILELEQAITENLVEVIGKEIDEAYQAKLHGLALQTKTNNTGFKIVYTPLHGSGNKPVRGILEDRGFQHVYVVPEQEMPDPHFSTVKSPNPEEYDAFKMAIELAKQKEADMILGTDPDTDRVGVVVRDQEKQYVLLTGNQLGSLLLEYILSQRSIKGSLPENGAVIKTIVTSELGAEVAAHYGLETINTLTGFKYIGEKIKQFEETKEKTFLFGYEESYGYLLSDFCRDKDAVQACMMAAEMGAYYHGQGRSLCQALLDLFEKYGYYKEDLVSLTLKGIEGVQQINAMMDQLRYDSPSEIAGISIVKVEDYLQGMEGLPVSDVLKFILSDHSWFAARPSGTEPKIKFYFGVKGLTLEESSAKLEILKNAVLEYMSLKCLVP